MEGSPTEISLFRDLRSVSSKAHSLVPVTAPTWSQAAAESPVLEGQLSAEAGVCCESRRIQYARRSGSRFPSFSGTGQWFSGFFFLFIIV